MGRAAATAVHLAPSGSLHQIDITTLQKAVKDNLQSNIIDPWSGDIVTETGSEGTAL
jgi:hypothetical protein